MKLDSRIRFGAQTLSGLIRISAPFDLGRTSIKPIADTFLAKNPKTTVELVLADGHINLVDEGIVIAVRFGSLAWWVLQIRSGHCDNKLFT
ncbi:MAG: hypothetical protein ACR2P1_01950 [Pseudomonadales bacterium]